MELAKALNCSIHDLPLHFAISWFEQKAVCVLLALLHLKVQNIKLGPNLPAFITPNILNFLVENYKLSPVTNADLDLKEFLK